MAECECQIEAAGMKTPLRMADNDNKANPRRASPHTASLIMM